jgi:hypothetical protein
VAKIDTDENLCAVDNNSDRNKFTSVTFSLEAEHSLRGAAFEKTNRNGQTVVAVVLPLRNI